MSNITVDSDTLKESVSSIEITKNSKGYNWKIKIYNDDTQLALKQALQRNEELKKKFVSEEAC